MYAKQTPRPSFAAVPAKLLMTLGLTGLIFSFATSLSAQSQVIRNITQPTQRLEMTVNTSRILTLEKRVPKMVVNNPELVSVTPISATQVQVAAKKPGVTQINLWDEDGQVYTVDLMIYGDVRELQMALKRLFPESSVKVVRLTNSLVLEGFVERPEAVGPIVRLSEDYAPKVINNITVGGVQQILLKVKVMEVSRTKLRNLGVDWAQISDSNIVASGVSGLINSVNVGPSSTTSGDRTFTVGVVDGSNSFVGIIDALQQNNVAKILADPTIVAISGRPAHFNVGGEIPIIVPSGLGQNTIEYKPFGTQIDFLPIVLGNGNIRLEVRPRISEIDDTRGVVLNSFSVPGLRVRTVDTAVELKAGQTLALAGLVQTRVEAQERALPFFGNLPYVGSAFRSVREEVNEIELLILVTPEFVDGMEPHEVPQCGPGMESVSPSNCQLYFGGHLEVPASGPCGPGGCGGPSCYDGAAAGCSSCNLASSGAAYASDAAPAPMILSEVSQEQPIQMQTQPQPNYLETGVLATPTMTLPTMTLPRTPEVARRNPVVEPSAPQRRIGTSTPGLMGPIGYDIEK